MVFIYRHLGMEDVKTVKDKTTKNWIDEDVMSRKIQIFEN